MPTTYTTVCEVGALMRTTFDCSTTPSTAQVETIINRQEDIIDQRTGHTYGRTKTITNEYYDLPLLYTFGWGAPIFLSHRDIRTDACNTLQLDPCAGDKVEIWNGGTNSFTDITANATGNYEILGERGELYIRGHIFTIIRKNRVRLTYRYGSTTVPRDITDACAKMAALDLITGSFRMDVIPMGADGAKVIDTTHKWKEDIDRVIRNREEFYFIP